MENRALRTDLDVATGQLQPLRGGNKPMPEELPHVSIYSQPHISSQLPAHHNEPQPQPGLPTLPHHPSTFPVSAAATSLALSPQDLMSREASALPTQQQAFLGARFG